MSDDHDFLLLHGTPFGDQHIMCKKFHISWPPPKFISIAGWGVFKQTNMSRITDEEINMMTHVARGAEYELASGHVDSVAPMDLDTGFQTGTKNPNFCCGNTDPGLRDGHSVQYGGGTDITRYTKKGL